VLKGLWLFSAAGAGNVGVLVEPGGVGGSVALRRSHLMDSPYHELLQTQKGVWGEGAGVSIVRGRGGVGGPVVEGHVPSAGPEGLVGLSHELGGGRLVPGGGGVCRMRGKRVRPSCRGRVRCARASTGRCFLKGREGTVVRQSRGR